MFKLSLDSYPRFTDKGTTPCSETDPEMYFPERGANSHLTETKMAKAVCKTCPYQVECLEWALEHREAGIWGGLSETERRKLIKKRQPKK